MKLKISNLSNSNFTLFINSEFLLRISNKTESYIPEIHHNRLIITKR